MNRNHQLLEQIKLYSVLVAQQEDMLDTFEKLITYDPAADFGRQQAEIKQFIRENMARIKGLQERMEGADGI